ncbi:MAG: dihydrofolate reductase [Candidatus Aenigmarchaeota archaeon]|nr:dihydrofolate reductase [Candidatus Aenigmarchaeota archaeon]
MSTIIVIAAVSENNVIGKGGKLPWNIPEDLQRFRQLTLHSPVIMGRKTYESLPVKPLKDRTNIVLTRDKNYSPRGCIVKHSLQDALEYCKQYGKVFIIGGQSVFEEGMKIADVVELTRVHKNYDGDAFFPEMVPDEWAVKAEEKKDGFSFLTYARRRN